MFIGVPETILLGDFWNYCFFDPVSLVQIAPKNKTKSKETEKDRDAREKLESDLLDTIIAANIETLKETKISKDEKKKEEEKVEEKKKEEKK